VNPDHRRPVEAALASCTSCLAWGGRFTRGVCAACYMFARDHTVGECVGRRRRQPLRNLYCRLCWNQARLHARQTGLAPGVAVASHHLHQVRHHQLFFADMLSSRGASTTPPRRRSRPGAPRKQPRPAARPVSTWIQPVLIDGLPRDFTRFVEPDRGVTHGPWVAWAHYRAHMLGESRGWTRRVRFAVNRALVILLTYHHDDEVIRYSEIFPALRALDLSVERTADVLEQMGLLFDDRQSTFEQWLPRKLDGIAPGIADEAEAWLRLLHQGGARSRARSMETVWQYLNMLRPVLLAWSSRAEHLREITRHDVLVVLDDLHGVPRQSTLIALRSGLSVVTEQERTLSRCLPPGRSAGGRDHAAEPGSRRPPWDRALLATVWPFLHCNRSERRPRPTNGACCSSLASVWA
jgi:hypothetical protein